MWRVAGWEKWDARMYEKQRVVTRELELSQERIHIISTTIVSSRTTVPLLGIATRVSLHNCIVV